MSPDAVKVSVDVTGSAQELFALFTDPDRLIEWMGTNATLDPVPGGIYSVRMGDGFGADGEFVALDPPRALSFTWGWAAGAGQIVRSGSQPDELLPPGSTRVEVSFEPSKGGSTRVTLTHHDLGSDQLRAAHHEAWSTYLDRLRVLAAGGDPGPDPHASADYTRTLHADAAPETVYDALVTPAAVGTWWSTARSDAKGAGARGGELVVVFNDQATVMRVDVATRPAQVVWSVVDSEPLPDWVGTTIHFDMSDDAGATRLDFRHAGLTPQLECFDMCRAGWDQYLPRLIAYAEGTLTMTRP